MARTPDNSKKNRNTRRGRRSRRAPLFELGFTKATWYIGALAILLIVVGYVLMLGGASDNPAEFHPEEVYHWRRITLAPIIVLTGYLLVIVAILIRKREQAQDVQEESG